MLLTWHNLQHYQDLMADLRGAVEEGRLAERAVELDALLARGDLPAVPDPLGGQKPAKEKKDAVVDL